MKNFEGSRWAILVPAALISWYLVFVIGLFVHRFAEAMLCPKDALISGFCHDAVVQLLLAVLMHLLVDLSAAVVICVSWWVAPKYKPQVIWLCYCIGALVAVALGASSNAIDLALAACIGGLLVVFALPRWRRARP